LEVHFLGEVGLAFLSSKQACWTHTFRHLGVGQQYPSVRSTSRAMTANPAQYCTKSRWSYSVEQTGGAPQADTESSLGTIPQRIKREAATLFTPASVADRMTEGLESAEAQGRTTPQAGFQAQKVTPRRAPTLVSPGLWGASPAFDKWSSRTDRLTW